MTTKPGEKKSASKDEIDAAKTLLPVSVPDGERSNDDETEKKGYYYEDGPDTIYKFMRLPRRTDKSLNHWVFGAIRNLIPHEQWPDPPWDILIAGCPEEPWLETRVEYPALIFYKPTTDAQATELAYYLIHAFTQPAKIKPDEPITVPRTWSTPHKEHIKDLEAEFTLMGLEPSLRKVGLATPQDIDYLERCRILVLEDYIEDGAVWEPEIIKPGDSNHCHGCSFPRASFFGRLSKCPKCALAWYHSEGCKTADWDMRHKYICGGLLHADLRARLRRLVFI